MMRRTKSKITIKSATQAFVAAFPLLVSWAVAQENNFSERRREELPAVAPSPLGGQALAIKPERWRFAETDNFILNFRRVTEARRVAREVEFTLGQVAKVLGFGPEQFTRKSHIFIFQDAREWRGFLTSIDMPLWTVSFARGDELFLEVRNSGSTARFDERTLAHEATHAIMARLYRNVGLPLWLHEGLAEYMAGESIAARKNQSLRLHQQQLAMADLDLAALQTAQSYPAEVGEVSRFYQSSERLFRFLCDGHPRERIRAFIDRIGEGLTLESAVLEIYGDRYKTFEEFEKAHSKFLR